MTDTDPVIPEFDAIGFPTAPYSKTRSEWAILVDGLMQGNPGPHLIGGHGDNETFTRDRLASWQRDRPTANARLVCRKITESAGEWEAAS